MKEEREHEENLKLDFYFDVMKKTYDIDNTQNIQEIKLDKSFCNF